ncbi:hypothetical protein [Streptomyces sp. NPDC059918]|uniref:hypothetical protein n=1 Tax=unclassified Streptomyces TaxID=2593676 RepID=UPI00365C4FFD
MSTEAEHAGAPSRVDSALIQRELRELTPEAFVNHYVIDRVPWIFNSRRQYVEWKIDLGRDLDVDPFSIVVVGSGCVGVSLSPTKNFSHFHTGSDIDVAIISPRHFDESWRWLRTLTPSESLALTRLEKDMFKWHHKNLIFDGTIAADRLMSKVPFGAQWTTGLARAALREPTEGREVKARIYRDFESLRYYQVKCVRDLRVESSIPDGEEASKTLKVKSEEIPNLAVEGKADEH